jgi:glycosyltransferase involved in cell wall biosynthesis
LRIAYLCNRYPAVSLTFIQREVRALRDLGMRIDTFAIRQAFPEHLLSAADREEYQSTFAVLPPKPARLFAAHAHALLLHPLRYAATLALALTLHPRGLRGLVWQCFYFAEAVLVWRTCHRRAIRHIHAHFANVAADVALLASHLGGEGWSWSFSLHGSVEFFEISQSRLAEKLRRAKFVICISDFARSQAMAFLEQPQWAKLHVVHCGVDLVKFRRAQHPPDSGPTRVLSVGRLIEAKGHAALLDAIGLVRTEGVDARLTVIGDGPQRAALESLSARRGLEGAVTLAGSIGQDEIAAAYAATDIFCLASFAEGLPVVLIEAMAMEIPVIATRIAGIPELIEDGVSGLLVTPGRPDQLADALAVLSRDPRRRRAIGIAAHAKVVAEFDVRDSAGALRAAFAAALAQPLEASAQKPPSLHPRAGLPRGAGGVTGDGPERGAAGRQLRYRDIGAAQPEQVLQSDALLESQ